MSENLLISVEEALISEIDEALREHPLGILRFIEAERERRGWGCSYRQARTAYADWVSPDRPLAFDARSLPNVIRVCGHARWLDVLLAEEARIQRQRRIGAQHEHRPGNSRRP